MPGSANSEHSGESAENPGDLMNSPVLPLISQSKSRIRLSFSFEEFLLGLNRCRWDRDPLGVRATH